MFSADALGEKGTLVLNISSFSLMAFVRSWSEKALLLRIMKYMPFLMPFWEGVEREAGILGAYDIAHEHDCGLGWPTICLPGTVPVSSPSV